MQADVAIVGAGPAGLCCAIRLAQLYQQHRYQTGKSILSEENIIVIDKAAEIGMHNLSGAILDPRALKELLPERDYASIPIDCQVQQEQLLWFTKNHAYRLPFVPKAMQNYSYPIVSLSKLVNWLAQYAEQLGVSVISNTAATGLLKQQDTICGIQTDDKGLDRNGIAKSNYEPGLTLNSNITVLAEGTRGSLSKQLIKQFDLDKDSNPPAYALGIKEVWEIPSGRITAGTVWHSSGYPLNKHHSGGAWMYALSDRRISLGLIANLNYHDAKLSPHELMQDYKQHSHIRSLLVGGKFLHYGAKTLSKGGYWSLPRPICNGAMLIGDNAGLVDSLRLKGIHLAMKSGMLAAETIFSAMLTQDFTAKQLSSYSQSLKNCWLHQEMWAARNHHQALQFNFPMNVLHLLAQRLTGGRGFKARYQNKPAHNHLRKIALTTKKLAIATPIPDNTISFATSTRVFHSGTKHEPEQPVHLIRRDPDICHPRCTQEYGNPCQYFCPAAVYEIHKKNTDEQQLQINAANCLHCKTCDIMDPYQIINWQPPEGGGGPQYESM